MARAMIDSFEIIAFPQDWTAPVISHGAVENCA
jgi:hypothetical protein